MPLRLYLPCWRYVMAWRLPQSIWIILGPVATLIMYRTQPRSGLFAMPSAIPLVLAVPMGPWSSVSAQARGAMSAETFWVDGVLGALVPPDDRGLNLADGAFETLRIHSGVISWRQLHAERLAQGLTVLSFPAPENTSFELLRWAEALLHDTLGAVSGTLRLTVTRGSGPRGYAIPEPCRLRTVLRFSPELPAGLAPANLTVSRIPWSSQPLFAGCKLLSRTEQVMAMTEARALGFDDGLMCDSTGAWLSTASGNLFLRRGSVLITPPLADAGIAGTRRRAVIEHCATALGYQVEVRPIDDRDHRLADEAMYCNAVIGMRSIGAVDGYRYPAFDAALALDRALHAENAA